MSRAALADYWADSLYREHMHNCPSAFTVVHLARRKWIGGVKPMRIRVECGRITDVDGNHPGYKHGGTLAGEVDGRPTRMEMEW